MDFRSKGYCSSSRGQYFVSMYCKFLMEYKKNCLTSTRSISQFNFIKISWLQND